LLRRFRSVPLPDERIPNGLEWYDYEDRRRQVVDQEVRDARAVRLKFIVGLSSVYRQVPQACFVCFVEPNFTRRFSRIRGAILLPLSL